MFELVKNAYDADAKKCSIRMTDLTDPEKGRMVIKDDGTGMDWDTVTGVWLEPGTDYRAEQRRRGKRTAKFHRLPLGEKGVGRFAAHKLGEKVRLITRKKDENEILVNIDWSLFERKHYLSEARVEIKERIPEVFQGKKTGTRIEISNLRNIWSRGMVRNLHRSVKSICSPFEGPEDFEVELTIEPDNGWLENLLDVKQALEFAMFRATCTLEAKKLKYTYNFIPLPGMDRVSKRTEKNRETNLSTNLEGSNTSPLRIGKVELELHIFDRDTQVLAFGVSDKKGLKDFLDHNGGIRVYRDGLRVYNYGEPENDWLDLGGKRVNVPAKRISNNLVIGAVSLELNESQDLIEKTNREGFVENEAYYVFHEAIYQAVQNIELERNKDKARIRQAYNKSRQKEPVLEDLALLRDRVEEHELTKELGPYLDRIESQFREVRDRLLTAAGAGLSLAIVIHEVEKGIGELNKALTRETTPIRLRQLAGHLEELVNGLTYLTRKSGAKKEKASVLLQQAIFNTEYRTQYHGVKVINGVDEGDEDFSIKCTRRLIISTLMNLIDNAIYWLENKGSTKKFIYLGTSNELGEGPAIVVADNGPGFIDPPEYLVQPFLTRKPDGMGLGLHLANEVMKAHGGKLEFPEVGDIELPAGINGAILALVFKGEE